MSLTLSEDFRSNSSSPTMKAPRAGIFAALWIPTDAGGKLRHDLLAAHVRWLKSKGLHGVLALGSTGEFARMNYAQREAALAAIVEEAAPLPVIANVSSIRLEEAVRLGQAARRFGAVGMAIMPPSFFPLAQEDILAFFLKVSSKVDLPVYLYNYPEVTGNRIGPKIISAFAEQAPMAGIKQSGDELSYHKDLIKLGREKGFSVFTAADPLLAKYMDMGAAGCFGGLANFVPEYMLEVFKACQAKRSGEAAVSSERLGSVGDIIGALCLPLNVRSGMEARGFDPGALKSVVSAETEAIYRQTLGKLREAFHQWKLPLFCK